MNESNNRTIAGSDQWLAASRAAHAGIEHVVTIAPHFEHMGGYFHGDCTCGAQVGGGIGWITLWLGKHLALVTSNGPGAP